MLRAARADAITRGWRLAWIGVAGIAIAALGSTTAQAVPVPPGPIGHWGVVPTRAAATGAATAGPVTGTAVNTAATGPNTLSFGGTLDGIGVVTGQPKVYLVFWGTQWGTQGTASVQGAGGYASFSGDASGLAPVLQAFFAGLGTSADGWSGNLTQYCQSSTSVTIGLGATACAPGAAPVGNPLGGALAGVWEDTAGAAPQSAGSPDLAAEAERAAGHFGNTTSASNRNALYVVVSPTGTHPGGFNTQSTGGFCAWHDDTNDTANNTVAPQTNGLVDFVNLPYLTDIGQLCGASAVNAGGTNDGVTIVAGHEYAEWLTDPIPGGGWYNPTTGYESADECAWIATGQGAMTDIGLDTGTFPVQSVWSNANNACETTGIAFTPGAPRQTGTVGTPIATVDESAIDPYLSTVVTYAASGLPPGLSISATTGQITGTPTLALTDQPAIITATDSAGLSSAITVMWTIAPAPTPPPPPPPLPPGPTRVSVTAPGRVVSLQTSVASIGVAAADTERSQTLTFTALGLPAGLAMNATSGRISGRVTGAPGSYTVRVTATDTAGASTTRVVLWIVQSPLVLTHPATQTTRRRHAVHLQLRVRDLIAHRTLHVAVAGLPSGVRLDPRTDLIRGTVSGPRRSYTVTITVTDSGGARITTRFTWRVR